jgi:hypothetical protein
MSEIQELSSIDGGRIFPMIGACPQIPNPFSNHKPGMIYLNSILVQVGGNL